MRRLEIQALRRAAPARRRGPRLARLARRLRPALRARRRRRPPDQPLRLVRPRAPDRGGPVDLHLLALRHLRQPAHEDGGRRAAAPAARRGAGPAGARRDRLLRQGAPLRTLRRADRRRHEPGAAGREPRGLPPDREAHAPLGRARREGADRRHGRGRDPAAPEAPGSPGDRLPGGGLPRRHATTASERTWRTGPCSATSTSCARSRCATASPRSSSRCPRSATPGCSRSCSSARISASRSAW